MPSESEHTEMNGQVELARTESVWKRIKDHLQNERRRIYEEIKNYPPPIPACDAQFNYLLEERARIAQELDRLEVLSRASLTRKDHIRCIAEFIMSSNYIDSDAEQSIRSSLLSVPDSGA